jgi:hypothetical protein
MDCLTELNGRQDLSFESFKALLQETSRGVSGTFARLPTGKVTHPVKLRSPE